MLKHYSNEGSPSVVGNDVRAVLDRAHSALREGNADEIINRLGDQLNEIRRLLSDEWTHFVESEFPKHPLKDIIWEDPFTRHSFEKPSGYPGDARLLDYIYGICTPPAATSEIGQRIFDATTSRPAPQSVRARRRILADAIDTVADACPMPRILSVACGHLREIELSRAFQEGRIGQLLAMDQDAESLAEVRRAYGHKQVVPVLGSIRSLLTGKLQFSDLDFVYSAGLYDYLADRVATKLTRVIFDMLAPGGKLLVANFAPCLPDIAYMETYMGWKLIYRTPQEVAALAAEITAEEWQSQRLFWDEHGNVVYMEFLKR